MATFYKIGFWVLVCSLFLLGNYFRTLQVHSKENFDTRESFNGKRIEYLFKSIFIVNRNLKSLNGKNIISNKDSIGILRNKSIAILLDIFKCNKCQEDELIRLNELKKGFEKRGINVIGLTTDSQRYNVIRQLKVTKIDFPVFVVEDSIFLSIVINNIEFPQIIFIENNFIIAGFIPIPEDDMFTTDFYKTILTKYE